MKIYIFLLLCFLLLVTGVIAEPYKEVLEFDANCVVEDVIVKIRGNKPIENTYSFSNCTKWKTDKWEFWKCKCLGQDSVTLSILNRTSQISYDVVAQIYIAPLEEVTDKPPGQIAPSPIEIDNMNKKRTYTFSNVIASLPPQEEKKSSGWKIPEFDVSSVSIIMFTVLGLAIGLVIFGVLWIKIQLKDDKPEVGKIAEPPPGFKKLKEEEVDDYVNKYT